MTRPVGVSMTSHLLAGSSCSQRLCCTVASNGSATASFLPRVVLPPAVYADNKQVRNRDSEYTAVVVVVVVVVVVLVVAPV